MATSKKNPDLDEVALAMKWEAKLQQAMRPPTRAITSPLTKPLSDLAAKIDWFGEG